MKAIETEYKGYRFRSRLVARWAVFFDSAGIRFLYEPQGFDLQGEWYLPDFLLPDHGVWVEIKPVPPNEREIRLASTLSREASQPVLILSGDCCDDSYDVSLFIDGSFASDEADLSRSQLALCRRCDGLGVLGAMDWEPDYFGLGWEIGRHTCGTHERLPVPFDLKHYHAARRARFEHGESAISS